MLNKQDQSQVIYNKLVNVNSMLNHDFCPWANRWVYWLKHPFWSFLLVIISSVLCGVFVNTAVLGLSLLLGLILIAGTIWPMIAMRGIDCELKITQHRVRVGQFLDLMVTVTNRWPWPIWGLQLKSIDGTIQSTALASISGWSKKEFVWRISATERGAFPRQPPYIETGFPFGLYHSRKIVKFDHVVLVWPQVVSLDALPDTVESQESSERYSQRHVGEFGDLMGTRPFRIGDSLRHVHWAQTARSGQMIVCERQAPVTTAITLYTDFSTKNHSISVSQSSLETSIIFLASICEYLHQEHGLVVCQIGKEYYTCGASITQYRKLMDALALIPREGFLEETNPNPHSVSTMNRPATAIYIATSLGIKTSNTGMSKYRTVIIGCDESSDKENKPVSPWNLNEPAPDAIRQLWRRICHAA